MHSKPSTKSIEVLVHIFKTRAYYSFTIFLINLKAVTVKISIQCWKHFPPFFAYKFTKSIDNNPCGKTYS